MSNKILQNSGWFILSILSLIPAVIWMFSSPYFSIRSFGDVAGLCGMAMFSLVMILSARLKFFEKFFKGINESYTAHHFFGGLAFVLLLFHPLFLAYNYLLVSFNEAALFLLPGQSWPKNFGILGLFVMIVTLVITFYTKLKYQVWKFTHKFLGIAFIFAFLHTFFIGADIATNQVLKIYLFVLGILAIITYFYRTLFADYFVRVFEYIVKDVNQNKDNIWEIELTPRKKEIKFVPGQFGFVKFFSKELGKEPHPFSFSSAGGNPLKIAVKELGDYTGKIGNLKLGDLVAVEGPFGAFSLKNHSNKKQVWIAGGVGVTPFLSMLRSVTEKDSDYKIYLYYSVKNENSLAFREEISEITQKYKNLKVNFWVTEERGFLTAKAVKEEILDLEERDVLICGPSLMMSALEKQLIDQGVNGKKIHMEEFTLY